MPLIIDILRNDDTYVFIIDVIMHESYGLIARFEHTNGVFVPMVLTIVKTNFYMDEDYGDGIDEYLSQIYDELVAHGFNPVHDQDDLIPIVIGDETNIMHLEPRYMWIYGVQTKMIEEKYF